jgi:hypothetical protein
MQTPPTLPKLVLGLVTSAVVAAGLIACSGEDDVRGARRKNRHHSAALTREEKCDERTCDIENAECRSDIEECNSSCLYGDLDGFDACYAICSGIRCPVCSPEQGECVSYGYSFSVTGRADPEIQSACETAVEHDLACGQSSVDPHCAHFAKLDRKEVVDAYACVARTPCGGASDACLELIPPSHLGTTICAGLAAGCGYPVCAPEDAATIGAGTRWLDEDVQAMAVACLDEPCDEGMSCLEAWLDAVFP